MCLLTTIDMWMLICGFILLLFYIYRITTHLRGVPMPPCNIIIGHYALFKNQKYLLANLTKIAIKYKGIFKIYIPPRKPLLSIAKPKLIEQILKSSEALEKGKAYKYLLSEWLGNGLLTAEVKDWKANRRMLTPCFGRYDIMENFLKTFEKNGEDLMETLLNQTNNTFVDIFPIAKMFTMNVMCETAMGVSKLHTDYREKYFNSIKTMEYITMNRTLGLFTRLDIFFRLTKDYKKQCESLKIVNDVFEIIRNEKLNKLQDKIRDEPGLCFLDLLLQYEKTKVLSKQYVKEELNTFLFGGHDTTATALAFTIYAISRNLEIQEKILAEQREIFGNVDNISTVSYTELKQMKYLELVINESLRMYPPIPVIGRRFTNDFNLGNKCVVPKGHSVVLLIYAVHHNPKYFPEPTKFIPERFQGPIVPYSFIPFSKGPRNCIGQKFAMLQLKSSVSKIVRNFKLKPSIPDYNLELTPAMTLTATNGIRISLEKRMNLYE